MSTTFTVTNTNDSGSGSLRQAILDANANPGADLITFAPSLDNQAIALTSGELQITDDLTIDGDLGDNGTPDITVFRNFLTAPDFRIFTIDDGDTSSIATVVLDGLTILGGRTIFGDGGGIFNAEALEVRNSIIRDNIATGKGNVFVGDGGGIFSRDGSLTIVNSTISNNSTEGPNASGGGIFSRDGDLIIANSTISNNSTAGFGSDGGGIVSINGNLTVSNSTISNNSNADFSSEGGGIFSINGNLTVSNSTISNNSTGAGSATFAGSGGGIFSVDGNLTVSNSTVNGNSSSTNGGGILSVDGNLTVNNSLIAGNRATNEDGDEIVRGQTGTVTLANNLFGDSSKTNAEAFLGFTPGASDITATSDGTNPTPLSDILEPLADNGGGTLTHALPEGSPAINAGNNANIDQDLADQDNDGDTTEPTPFDQRGNGFNRVSGGVVDIGAFEVQLIPGIDLEKFVNGEDADTEAIQVPVDAPIDYTYRLTNTGDIPFDVVSLLDDNGTLAVFSDDLRWRASDGAITIATGITLTSGDNGNLILEPGEVWEFAALPQVAREGLVTNTADAGGTQTVGLIGASDRDTASYNGFVPLIPSIDLEKFVNGVDADTPQDAVTVNLSDPITYAYTIENTGNVPFNDLQLIDDNGTPSNFFDDLSWTISDILSSQSDFTFNGGDDNNNLILDPGEVWQLAYGVSPLDVQLGLVTSNASIIASDFSIIDLSQDFEPDTSNASNTSPTTPIIIGNPSASDADAANYVGTTTNATIFVNAINVVVGNAFQSGQLYDDNLASNTDSTFGTGLSPDDVIEGTDGNDNIWSGLEGNDQIEAGNGDDIIGISDGNVTVVAGAGDDLVYAAGVGDGNNTIDLGAGNDSFWSPAGNNVITGTGNNTLGLGSGNDTVTTTGNGNDSVYSVDGGGGLDTLNLGDGENTVWVENGDYTILTGAGNDIIGLGSGNNSVEAGDGNNVIYMATPTSAANDVVTGIGNDWVQTGSGDDTLDLGTNAGGSGDFDIAFGQGGSDTFVLNEGSGYLTVGDFTQGEDLLEISGIPFNNIQQATSAGRTWVWTGSDILAELDGVTETLTASDFSVV